MNTITICLQCFKDSFRFLIFAVEMSSNVTLFVDYMTLLLVWWLFMVHVLRLFHISWQSDLIGWRKTFYRNFPGSWLAELIRCWEAIHYSLHLFLSQPRPEVNTSIHFVNIFKGTPAVNSDIKTFISESWLKWCSAL